MKRVWTFEQGLSSAADWAADRCREISNATSSKLDKETAKSEVYGAEGEAAFKALLFSRLREGRPLNSISLEPGNVYGNVDLVHCETGLTWRSDDSRVNLVEVKRIAKDNGTGLLVRRNIVGRGGIKHDLEKLQNLTGAFPKAERFEVLAFVDSDTADYYSRRRRRSWRRIILAQLADEDAPAGGVRLVVC